VLSCSSTDSTAVPVEQQRSSLWQCTTIESSFERNLLHPDTSTCLLLTAGSAVRTLFKLSAPLDCHTRREVSKGVPRPWMDMLV